MAENRKRKSEHSNRISDKLIDPDWAPLSTDQLEHREPSLSKLEEIRRFFGVAQDYVLGNHYPEEKWKTVLESVPDDQRNEVISDFTLEIIDDFSRLEESRKKLRKIIHEQREELKVRKANGDLGDLVKQYFEWVRSWIKVQKKQWIINTLVAMMAKPQRGKK